MITQIIFSNKTLQHYWCIATTLTLLMLATEYSGLRGLIPRQLIHCLLKSQVHQQTWFWLCRTYTMYCCSRLNLVHLDQTISKIRSIMWIYLLKYLKTIPLVNRFAELNTLLLHSMFVWNPSMRNISICENWIRRNSPILCWGKIKYV